MGLNSKAYGFYPTDLEILSEAGEVRVEHQGRILLREGDSTEEVYILREGELGVFKKQGTKEVMVSKLGPGNFFGMLLRSSENLQLRRIICTTKSTSYRHSDG